MDHQNMIICNTFSKCETIKLDQKSDLFLSLMCDLCQEKSPMYEDCVDLYKTSFKFIESIHHYVKNEVHRHKNSIIFNDANIHFIDKNIQRMEENLFLGFVDIKVKSPSHNKKIKDIFNIISNYDFEYYTCHAYDEWKSRSELASLFHRVQRNKNMRENIIRYESFKQPTKKHMSSPKWPWSFFSGLKIGLSVGGDIPMVAHPMG